MRTTAMIYPHWPLSGPLKLLPLLLVSSLIASKAVGASATAASATLSTTKTSVNRLDLSYLHRCQAGDLAKAIRGTLEEQKELDQQQQQRPTTTENDGNESLTKEQAPESVVVDIDLTASLIGKNLSEIILSMQREKEESSPSSLPLSSSLEGKMVTSSTVVRLTARRNQWSPSEATRVLDFVSNNGPTNETTIAVEADEPLLGEVETTDGNTTAEIVTITNVSSSLDDSNSDASDGMTDGDNDNDAETKESAEPIAEKKVTITTRPAFVSIKSLDLGWNNLGSDSTKSGSKRRTAAGGVRAMNKALRKLLSDPGQCPPTIRLDVCGLGPSACRDVAMGIVERYQKQSDPDDNKKVGQILVPPPPLSLDLARNEGIGDVGVAALAAAIRTVASKQHGNSDIVGKGKKKRRRKKKRTKRQSQEEGNEEEEIKQEIADDVDNETEVIENKTQGDDSSTKEDDSTSAGATARIIVFEHLDLSGCGIGDVGAEALAIALKNHPLCIKHLDLSNNQISDEGAVALARVLGTDDEKSDDGGTIVPAGLVQTLDLSHNKELGDRGAKELARAFQEDGISNLILRSCNVRADGAACFGIALRAIGSRARSGSTPSETTIPGQQRRRLIDLSGNPLGVLSKKKKSGSKYSATALRSKATDTTKAYMNIIGKSFQKGLSSINSLSNGDYAEPDTLESDDEEDERMGANEEDDDDSRKKCGALSLALAFIEGGNERDVTKDTKSTSETGKGDTITYVELALRHCSFDTKAAEALAAVLQNSRQMYPTMKLTMDMTMNDVLEEDIIDALHGEEGYDDQLADMAEVYLDALEVMREARERALKAAKMAAARAKARADRESAWDTPPPGSRYDDDSEGGWSDDTEEEHWGHPIDDDYDRIREEDYSDDEW